MTKLTSTTTKYRLVHNASLADESGQSLNGCLFKGETTWDILRNLIHFQMFQYPLVGDLEKAFLQVQLAPEFRDLFRFIYPDLTQFRPLRFVRIFLLDLLARHFYYSLHSKESPMKSNNVMLNSTHYPICFRSMIWCGHFPRPSRETELSWQLKKN